MCHHPFDYNEEDTNLYRRLMEWKNRIVGFDTKPAKWFLANEQNWRIHPMVQQSALKGSLEAIGWIQDVIVNKRTSEEWGKDKGVETLIDGHLRISLALREGDDIPVPVKYVDLSPVEENMALLFLDPIAAMASTDVEKLEGLMRQIQTGNTDVMDFLKNLAEKEGVYLTDTVDLTKFSSTDNKEFLFRVVVEDIPSREEADHISAEIPNSHVEQYPRIK